MTSDAPAGSNAETIRKVHAAAEKLGAEFDTEGSGAAKTGAVIKEEKSKKAGSS